MTCKDCELPLPMNILTMNMVHVACRNGQVKLRGGKYSNEGTVLVCYDKLWGLISDNGWSAGDAKVVCNTLGYHNGSKDHVVIDDHLILYSIYSC